MSERRAEYYRRRGKWIRIYDLRYNCTAILVKDMANWWSWRVYKQLPEGYALLDNDFATTLAEGLRCARRIARAKGKGI